jgi:Fe-S-cluster containining protein
MGVNSELGTRNSELKQRVLAIYDSADRAVAAAGPRCEASGRCCRFAEYGHTLFVSELEAAVLLDSAPRYKGPVSPDFCPFQKDNLCTAREPRPLGCRVYFCDPNYQEKGTAITEVHLRMLKEMADELGAGWRYAPLHVFLNEAWNAERGTRNDPESTSDPNERMSPARIPLSLTLT